MNILLKRFALKPLYTVGHIYIDGKYITDSLEPPSRHLTSEMKVSAIQRAKLPDGTAIPTGTYRILITRSPRFGKWLPLLLDVPGFSGVRIHAGNTKADTTACILPGKNRYPGRVISSTLALHDIINRMTAALSRGEKIFITITESQPKKEDAQQKEKEPQPKKDIPQPKEQQPQPKEEAPQPNEQASQPKQQELQSKK